MIKIMNSNPRSAVEKMLDPLARAVYISDCQSLRINVNDLVRLKLPSLSFPSSKIAENLIPAFLLPSYVCKLSNNVTGNAFLYQAFIIKISQLVDRRHDSRLPCHQYSSSVTILVRVAGKGRRWVCPDIPGKLGARWECTLDWRAHYKHNRNIINTGIVTWTCEATT